jgi:hypothetical protein
MYSALISPRYYSNNEIKVLVELYITYNKDMSPVFYTSEQVKCTKKSLSLLWDVIDSKILNVNSNDEDESRPIVILTNKVVSIIKNQTNPLTDQE